MSITETDKGLLALVAAGLGNKVEWSVSDDVDWMALFDLSEQQGGNAICVDGLQVLTQISDFQKVSCCEPQLKYRKLQWFGLAMRMEQMYEQYVATIGKLARFYENLIPNAPQDCKGRCVKMLLMKGYGFSLNYPVPSHRPTGDIDIYNFGLQEFADQMVIEKLGIEVDNSHMRHSVFTFDNVSVENHYDFIDDNGHPSDKKVEALLKSEAREFKKISVRGSDVCLPSDRFNAIFLAKHCAGDFCSTGMTLRQVLDWLLFMKQADKGIWSWAYEVYCANNMTRFVNVMNAIGVRFLGFGEVVDDLERSMGMSCVEKDDALVDRVVNDMLHPDFAEHEDGSLMSGLSVKMRRWWGNRWKQKICYPDNLASVFVHTIAAKLKKPSHFRH